MEETTKTNSVSIRTKISDAIKYLLSCSEYWWNLSVTSILLINTVAMLLFISAVNPEYAATQSWTTFFLILRGLVFILIFSFMGQAFHKLFYGYSGNKYKKLGGEET